ncbi:type IV pili methyl-accepting chemotaxis transducer N-terminal domain-containing protein [Aestuariibius insulae]|uniref:type IV pili methyl-accepting chemotaxis transducer N-terminal domain-containing protein n=1 Tax=Aestuariibius insulae TaxID=2058287 RepID=UPI00345E149A
MPKLLHLQCSVALACLALSPLNPTTPAAIASSIQVSPESVGTQIDVAGRQRMLSQRMAKSFCYAVSGIDEDRSIATLDAARDLYRRSHVALRRGDAELGLFEENDPKVNDVWSAVDLRWIRTDAAINDALAAESVTDEMMAVVVKETGSMLGLNNDLVTELRTAYTRYIGSSDGFQNTLLIDFYGRQRMLSQKLAKEVCVVAQGYDVPDARDALIETLEIFETSLTAFIDGMQAAGIPPAPTSQIRDQLLTAKSHWDPAKPVVEAVLAETDVPDEDLARFDASMDEFLVEMNKAVGMLVDHTALSDQ